MGCVSSKRKTGSNSLMFKVTNVDYSGNEINHGQIEITDNDLLMHYASEKSTTSCALSTIRRYGYEDCMFCFEAGRSFPYGEGIFAFRSNDAENIFKTIKGKLQILNDKNIAKERASEVFFYAGQPRTNRNEHEDVYDEIRFSGIRSFNRSKKKEESPYLELGSIKSCPTYANIILKPIENNEELVYCGNSYVTPKEEVTYTEVEIAVCKTKKKELPVPSKTEISEYTVIDFERTRRFNNRSLYFPSSGGRTYRTRHDVGAITPP
ncbi:IRS-type PTB domain-containing protein [Aphis craccivora]|uniref:IRS-type PTB domain-containing protein n=1 Tax=Aphis craccivora TaxID=307492 RepID=A0A6G0ZBM6_APHCR|nr:IRS-type PTB domain-containing protein [Aphis craccivora]